MTLAFICGLLGCSGVAGPSSSPATQSLTPEISLSASSINFGSQADATTQAVTVTNTGTGNLVISSLAIAGSGAAEFSFTAGTMPMTVEAGGSTTITLTFTPTAPGSYSATLAITDNATGSPHTVALAGSSSVTQPLTPEVSLSTSSISFGNQAGATTQTVTVANTGTGNLVISSLVITGSGAAQFAATAGTLPVTVGPGGSTTITLTFTPTVPGNPTATLAITDNASGSPHTVALSGVSLLQNPGASVSLTPDSGQAGSTVTVAIQGNLTNFIQGATGVAGTTADFGPGIVVGAGDGLVTVNNPTSATVQVQIGTQAAPGPRQVVVNTGGHLSSVTFQVLASGSGPVANAGPPQFAQVGNTVQLDGSRSTCVSNSGSCGLSFQWSFLSEPQGSTAQLTNATSVTPSFTIDQPGNYVVQLQAGSNGGTQKNAVPADNSASGDASSTASVVSTLASVTVSTQNTSPVADAGANQFVTVGAKVQLDGSGSSDADGDPLTYQWSFVSLPTGSGAVLSDATAVAPTFVADMEGAYVLQLVVNDGVGNTAAGTVQVSTQPTPPIANAGPDQHVSTGDLVQLDGSQSKAPDGDTLTYAWTFTFIPAGSTAVLTGAARAGPSFTADQSGAYGLQLVVTDSHGNSSIATVMVTTNPIPPVAVAGNPQQVPAGSTVQLDGSQSSGPPTSYQWTLLSKPNLSAATLSDAGAVNPTFVADQPGFYVAQLIVSDGVLTSIPGTVLITVTIPGFAANPGSVSFGNQVVGSTSSSFPVVITNTGTGGLTISRLTVTGANASEFAFTAATLPVTVAPNESTTVNVTFTPAALGGGTATLNVSDNAPGAPHAVALSGTGIAGPPASVTPAAGTPQSVAINTAFTALQVIVTDASGDPLSGVSVLFTAPASGASGTFGAGQNPVLTNAQGVAAAPAFTANSTVGSYTVTAAVTGVSTPASFALTNLAGPPASITATAGSGQKAAISNGFVTPLQVTVKDAGGNPVNGAMVTFVAPASGASGTFGAGPNPAPTNAQGVAAAPTFTANTTAGTYTVTAAVAGVTAPASFTLTNLAGPAASVTATAGTQQKVVVSTAFTNLQVTVTDASGNPVSGAMVTFAAPASGAGGTFGAGPNPAPTNAQGVATAPTFTANTTAGTYTVTATVAGVTTPASFTLTNLAGPAASVTATAGTQQRVAISTAFATNLQVTVTDASGNPVNPATVTFTAPASGASGTFANGANSITVPTNAQGVAAATPFTANTTAGSYAVLASVAGVTTPASFALTNLVGPAASITATAGAGQKATISSNFATTLQATVSDAGGNPVNPATVTFTAPASGASGTFANGANSITVPTNAQGVAAATTFTANTTAGSYAVLASVAGVTTPASFTLTNQAGPAASVTATAGTQQSATIDTVFAPPLQVTVKDLEGNGVSGATVIFTAPASGASGTFANGANSTTANTNAQGVAAAAFTANSTAGTYTVTATVAGVTAPASFTLTNQAGPAASVTATAGTQESATIDTIFAPPLQATVKDASGNPVSGAMVTFVAPASGASGTFGAGPNPAPTNAQGVAAAPPFTANTTAGTYTVTATVAGVTTPASFTLTNQAGPAASVTATAGAQQSVSISTAFATNLQVTVTDASGNPINPATVTFTAPASGASGTFANGANATQTNAQGVATAPTFTANTTAGTYTVTATVAGVTTPASFTLTNQAGPAASVTATAGAQESATISAIFAPPLQATVKDASGNPVSGAMVTFAAPASGAGGTFGAGPNPAPTNAQGVATAPTFTANTTAGTYTVTAAVAGVTTPASFTLTNQPGPAASVTATAGTRQSVTINSAFATPLQATVTDEGGNAVGSGVPVIFAAPASGASGMFANGTNSTTAMTNAQGVAAATPFTANGTGGAYTVTAAVSGVANPASFVLTNLTPILGLNPASVPFGNQLVSSSSAPVAVTISNTGLGTLLITGLAITGANAADFSFTAAGLPITVNPNGSTTVNVTFTPMLTGSRTATLALTDNAGSSPQTVALTGTGTAPFIGITPTAVSFGNQPANVASAPVMVTISNSTLANANLVISNLQITGANAVEFAFTAGTLPITVAPGSSTTVNVTFTPAAAGMRSAALVITDNDTINLGGSPHTVALSGNGIAPGISIAAVPSFSLQLVNTTSPATNVTVTNSGTANLVIYGVAFTGANAADFAYSGVQPLTISPGNSSPLAITFTPQGSGSRSAILNLYDNLNGGTQQSPHTDTVGLSGTGVVLGTLVMPPLSVGANLEVLATVGLSAPASASLPITITSPDPTKVLLSASATQAGAASIVVTVPPTGIMASGVYVQSLDVPAGAPDTLQLSVSAPGYAAISCTLTLTPSALVLAGSQGYGQNFSTNLTGDVALTVAAYGLDSNSNISGSQQMLAGGLSENVSVTSSDTSIGVILNSPGVLAGGNSVVTGLTFQPAGSGSTQLAVVEPPGFTTPASGSQLTALVGAPQILLNPTIVGFQLQVEGSGQLSDPAPATGLQVTVTSNTPNTVLLSSSPTESGSSSIVLTVAAGATALPTFYVQGVAVGSGQLYATTPPGSGYNFNTGNSNGGVTVTPSGFVISAPGGSPGQNFSTTTISGTTPLTLTLMRLDPGNKPAQVGQLMAGATASVGVSSGTPGIGVIVDSPVIFSGGESTSSAVYFSPLAVGSSALSVVQPPGFSTPTSGAQLTAVVSPPQISLSLTGTTIGANLQLPATASLNAPAPAGGMVVTIKSSDPSAVLVSPVANAQGSSSINVSVSAGSGLNGVGFPQFFIQALQSSGSVTLTASSSPNWVSGTITVNLSPSGFVLASANGIGQDFGTYLSQGVNTPLTVQAMQLSASGVPQTVQALSGGLTENVSVTSEASYIGTIVGSPVTISGGSASGSVSFQPDGVGVTLLTVWAPSGFTTPSTGSTLNADVN